MDKEVIKKAEQCLIDNGIDVDEASTVLQALGYILLDTELYPKLSEEYDEKSEKEWIVPVAWEQVGFIKVKAENAEKAFEKVHNDKEDYPLPSYSEYTTGSFDVACESPDLIEIYTKMYEKGELSI